MTKRSNFSVNAKEQNINEADFKEIKASEVLRFLDLFAKKRYKEGYRKTRQLFPEFTIIAKNTHLSIDQVRDIVSYLEDRGDIIRKTSQRYLKWVWEKLNQKYPHLKQQLEKEETKKEVKKTNKVDLLINKVTTFFNFITLPFFKLLTIFTIVTGTYLSIYFTYLWFNRMFDQFRSILWSLFIVFSSLIAFQVGLWLKKAKNKLYFLFFFLWIGIISLSIFTGISGQLNLEIDKKIKKQETTIIDNSKVLLFKGYSDRIQSLKEDLISVRNERDKLMEFLNSIVDFEKERKTYNDLNYRIYLKKQYIEDLKNNLNELELKKEELLKENVNIDKVQQIDFFDWLESILKIKADIIKFVIYLILAIFADLIPPVNFSFVLFYKNKE